MAIQRIVPGQSNSEHWTLRCTKCGHIHQAQVSIDPLSSEVPGWFDGELKPPQ
jgi:uncharacterized Zn finger protein